MATDFTVFSRHHDKADPLDCDIKVIQAYIRNRTSAEVNIPIPIPWEDVRLVKAIAVVSEVIDNVGAWAIDFELDKAGGTEMMSIDIAASDAVGTIYEATVTNQAACERLSSKNPTRDAIVIEADSAAAASYLGAANIFLIFEPDSDNVV